jgi:hypothetical protein
MTPFSAADLALARTRSHARFRIPLADGAARLDPDERHMLLETADALLDDRSDAAIRRASAHDLLMGFVRTGRWLLDPAAEAHTALDGCGDKSHAQAAQR